MVRFHVVFVASVSLLAACGSTTTTPDAGIEPCPVVTGAGTTHSYPKADETWTAAGSPHVIDHGFGIPEGVTVTIEACAQVQLGPAVTLSVAGKLVTKGTEGRPVTFTRLDATKPWGSIDASRTKVMPALDFTWTVFEGGGAFDAADRELSYVLRGRANAESGGQPMLKVDHVWVKGSDSAGINLEDSATFAEGSTALVVTGSRSVPVRLNAWAVTNLPDGDYSGNEVDRLLIPTHERLGVSGLTKEVVFRKRNVPYRIGGFGDVVTFYVGASTGLAVTTVRIEPGVTIAFKPGFVWYMASVDGRASAELVAQGTAEQPITFTSDAPVKKAGDWIGLFFGGAPGPATVLDHVVLAYAGNEDTQTSGYSCGTPPSQYPGGNKGALTFASNVPITRQILTNSVVIDSGSNGIDRGWTGAPVDYLAGNSFTRVAYCLQTLPRPDQGLCPDPAPCPLAP